MGEELKTGAPELVMYTAALCGFCSAARKLLQGKGINFTEINVTLNAALRREMINRSGRRTVPQIFIDGQAVGGYDDIAELDRCGELDTLLGVAQ